MHPNALRALALLLALASAPLPARSGETWVEDFAGERAYTARWNGGRVLRSGQASLRWARIHTPGRGEATFVTNAVPFATPVDTRGRFVKIWLRVDAVRRLAGAELRLSSDGFGDDHFAFPIALYGDPHFNLLSDDVWTTLSFSFGAARVVGSPDRAAIDSIGLFVSDTGEAPVRIDWGGLVLVDAPAEGVVSFTFDDGYDEHHTAARLMARHGLAGTAYVIPEAIGQPGYLTLRQLLELRDRYRWDVAAHHAVPFTEMDAGRLEREILGIKHFLDDPTWADGGQHLAYPLGKQEGSLVRPLVRAHFATARVAAAGPETLPPADPHLLRVLNVLPSTTPEQVGAAARRAREHGEWLILMLHYLVEEPAGDLEYGLADFERLVAAVADSGVRVLPVSQVWAQCGARTPRGRACDIESLPAKAAR